MKSLSVMNQLVVDCRMPTAENSMLFVGEPTRLGNALNDLIRRHATELRAGSVNAFPNRVVTRSLRETIGETRHGGQLEGFFRVGRRGEYLLVALKILDQPSTAFKGMSYFRKRSG